MQFPQPAAAVDVLDAMDEFRTHVESEAAVSIAMVAIAANGSCLSRYTWKEGASFFALNGAVQRLANRLMVEN